MITSEATEIIPNLWLGNIHDSQNKKFIGHFDTVINCTKDLKFVSKYTKNIRIPLDDNLDKHEILNLYNFLPKITTFIYQQLGDSRKVFIHCYAGKQRSASIVVAFCMKYLNMTLADSIYFLTSKRIIVFTPFINFNAALIKYSHDITNPPNV